MRISDWSSDVCSSDLRFRSHQAVPHGPARSFRHSFRNQFHHSPVTSPSIAAKLPNSDNLKMWGRFTAYAVAASSSGDMSRPSATPVFPPASAICLVAQARSEEHKSELQSLMRISYAVFCLKN